MCRRKSCAMQSIEMLCASQNMNATELQAKAKLLLSSYRRVCWASLGSCQLENDADYLVADEEIEKALDYLQIYSPTEDKDSFERNLKMLFETKWMIELVDSAMLQVKEYPGAGDEYFEIISKFFLSKFRYSESDLLQILSMERSRYYDRKKEAVLIFGLALWGTVIPKLRQVLLNSPIDCPD